MKLAKQKTIIISTILISLLVLFIGTKITTSQTPCTSLEYLKLTANGLECVALPSRTNNTYITQIFEAIIHPEIPTPPLLIPNCIAGQKYIYTNGSWGCRGTTLSGIDFIGCTTGKYLNKITGGVICSTAVVSSAPVDSHEHPNYAILTHSHADTFSSIDHIHQGYAGKIHFHTYPYCGGDSKVLQFDGTNISCVTIESQISFPTCPVGQFLTANGVSFSCVNPTP